MAQPLTSGLLHYWKFDVNTNGNRADEVGDTTLSPAGAGVSTTNEDGGIINRGAEFQRSDYLKSSSGNFMPVGDNPFSLSFWVNADVWTAGGSPVTDIVTKWQNSSAGGTDFEYMVRADENINANGRFRFFTRNSTDDGQTTVLANTFGDMSTRTGEWIHIVTVHDPDNDRIGINVNNTGFDYVGFSGGIQTTNQGADLCIGSRDLTSTALDDTKFDGIFDEFGIWDRVLTSDDVSDLYNSGDGLSFDSFDAVPAAPSGLEANPVSDTKIYLGWDDLSDNEDNFIIERSTSGPSTGFSVIASGAANSTTHDDTGLTAETTYYYRVKATNDNGDSGYSNVASGTTQEQPPADPALTYRLEAHWSFEEKTASGIRFDDTDNNIDLTPRNDNTPSGLPLIGEASVNANENGLEAASATDLSFGTKDFTVAGWVNSETWTEGSSTSRLLFTKWNATGMEYQVYADNANDRLQFIVRNEDDTANKLVKADNFSGVASRTDEWIFVAGWHDAVNRQIGIQVNDLSPDIISYSSGVFSNSSTVFSVGTRDGGGFATNNNFKGRIDNAGVWSRVLTSGDLSNLYNGGSGLAYPLTVGGGGGNGGGAVITPSDFNSLFLFF